jgi:hypothetical protein
MTMPPQTATPSNSRPIPRDARGRPTGYGVGPGDYAVPNNPPDIPYLPAIHGYTDPPADTVAIQRNQSAWRIPPPGHPPQNWNLYNSDRVEIFYPLETLQGEEGWPTPTPRYNRAPDSRWQPAEVTRPTTQQSPSTFRFHRPFDQHAARQLNGNHFSMADHTRAYPIAGMQPQRNFRNTFRLEPAPWDTEIVDRPEIATPSMAGGTYISPDLPPSVSARNGSYRLS